VSLQKDVFLSAEGDAWFTRNESGFGKLEIGLATPYADGSKHFHALRTNRKFLRSDAETDQDCNISQVWAASRWSDLSLLRRRLQKRARVASRSHVQPRTCCHSQTHPLTFWVFGFCLYLCDDADLFRIALEADSGPCRGRLVADTLTSKLVRRRISPIGTTRASFRAKWITRPCLRGILRIRLPATRNFIIKPSSGPTIRMNGSVWRACGSAVPRSDAARAWDRAVWTEVWHRQCFWSGGCSHRRRDSGTG